LQKIRKEVKVCKKEIEESFSKCNFFKKEEAESDKAEIKEEEVEGKG